MSTTALTPPPAAGQSAPWAKVVQGMVFPLFFIVMFSVCYISAFHHPVPRHAIITLVGPAAQTSAVDQQLTASSGDMFDIRTSTTRDAPLKALEDRKQIGVIEFGQGITAHTASAGGLATANVVQKLAQQLGAASGMTVTVSDHAPLPAGDNSGAGVFYFIIICTLGGYLTVTVLSQVAPGMRVRDQLIPLGALAVITPALVLLIGGLFIGAYSGTAPGILAMAAVGAAYAFTLGLVAILFNLLFKQAAIFAVMTVAIFLNFPSAGGGIVAPMLPAFWAFLNKFWIGAGAVDAARAVLYFDGAGVGHGLTILAGWLIVAALALALAVRLLGKCASVLASVPEPIDGRVASAAAVS